MSERLGASVGQFHHLAQSRTCGRCGNALGTADHDEACSVGAYLTPEEMLDILGLSSVQVQAIGRTIIERAEESGQRLQAALKAR